MLILSVDSTATPASVCLFDGRVIAEYYIHTALTHSQTLMKMISSVFEMTSYQPDDVDLFAVNNGPGSFTGVRIGVSAVKGIAFSQKKPCLGVSTLESMAFNFLSNDAIICACMDARRHQVYNALFRVSNGTVTRLCEDRAISIEELKQELLGMNEKIIFAGDGGALVFDSFEEKREHLILAPENIRYQRASSTAMCAGLMREKQPASDAFSLSVSYLRLSQAERERLEKQQKEEGKSL